MDKPWTQDVVIPIHRLDRPLGRTVESVLDGNSDGEITVIVVAHGLPGADVADLLTTATRDHVRVIECHEAPGCPGAPKNAGIRAGSSDWVSVVDSDDEVTPGAFDAWHRQAARHGADVIMARERIMDGASLRTPMPRPGRGRALDFAKDRLAYQSAFRGIARRSTIERTGAYYDDAVRTGEDLVMGLRLFTGAERIELGTLDSHYLVRPTPDSASRSGDPVAALTGVQRLTRQPWIGDLPRTTREALAVKLCRVQVLGPVRGATPPQPEVTAGLIEIAAALSAVAPGYEALLGRHDLALLEALRSPGTHWPPPRPHGHPSTILTGRTGRIAAANAPLRTYIAAAMRDVWA